MFTENIIINAKIIIRYLNIYKNNFNTTIFKNYIRNYISSVKMVYFNDNVNFKKV